MAKILAVDDSLMIRKLVEAVLTGAGHEVVVANDGVLGLEAARAEVFDLVLTDLNMPNMSGMSFASKLRRMSEYDAVPIVVLTTESGDYKKNKAKSTGINAWLQKPFDQDRLLAAVDAMLEKSV